MANLYRIGLVWLLVVGSGLVFADTYPAKKEYWLGGVSYPSAAAACGAYEASHPGCSVLSVDEVYSDPDQQGRCVLSGGAACSWSSATYPNWTWQCPYGGVLSGGQCVDAPACPSGQSRDATGQCVASCPAAGTKTSSYGSNVFGQGSGTPSSLCLGGCGYDTGDMCVAAGGAWVCSVGKSAGRACTGSDAVGSLTDKPDPPGPTAYDCLSRGQNYGTVNGQVVCVAGGSAAQPLAVKQQTTTTTNNPDGSATTATQIKTTTDNGSSVTVQVSGGVGSGAGQSGGQGAASGNGTTDQSKSAFCEENPNSPLCKTGSVSGGVGCADAPVCEGDAVQCALVMQDWRLRCAHDSTPQSELAESIFAGNDPAASQNPALPSNAETVDMVGRIDSSNPIGGSCPQDRVFTVWRDATVTLPFSQLCQYLDLMGRVVVAFAFVGAARIIGGA